ncbi:hypothetical protein ALC56_12758 [Trachymyrmex septentrionalis]|uniref:Uncharacterized protein n=1 Tax=Trachymyrmex septentrionalis TaxID=34720 RepID=A0A195EYF8_9HYME|nr:hypothetical protein ALC56_12758 [Trachymyrmex septentrionalis]
MSAAFIGGRGSVTLYLCCHPVCQKERRSYQHTHDLDMNELVIVKMLSKLESQAIKRKKSQGAFPARISRACPCCCNCRASKHEQFVISIAFRVPCIVGIWSVLDNTGRQSQRSFIKLINGTYKGGRIYVAVVGENITAERDVRMEGNGGGKAQPSSFRHIFFSTLPPSFYRVFCAKGLLTARFVAELTKDELYRKWERTKRVIPYGHEQTTYFFVSNNNAF